MRILSIDAWAGCEPGLWEWNNWYHVGDINNIPETNRGILKHMRDEGFLSEYSKGKVTVEDDGYNLVIIERSNQKPLFAIEYGREIF